MKTFIEKEYKSELSLNEYNSLLNYFTDTNTIIQTNYYFDTPNFDLRKKGFMARIRVINNEYTFTLKTPKINFASEEHNQIVPALIIDENVKKVLNKFNLDNNLIIVASATTKRTIHKDNYGEWCLDKTNFSNNTIDYELEYELFDSEIDRFDDYIQFLKKFNIEYKPIKSKVARALNTSSI